VGKAHAQEPSEYSDSSLARVGSEERDDRWCPRERGKRQVNTLPIDDDGDCGRSCKKNKGR
jgi:hypothetical protein